MNDSQSDAIVDCTSLFGDRESFKKHLMDKVRAQGGTGAMDTKQLFQSLVQQTMEGFLELEMEEHLGYSKHDPSGHRTGNSRMGIPPKPFAVISAKCGSIRRGTETALRDLFPFCKVSILGRMTG